MALSEGLRKNYNPPERLSFPEDEKNTDWLEWLLDAYYTADLGLYRSILKEEKKGRVLACSKGCSTCCSTHSTIPVYPMEILGIYWYAILHIDDSRKRNLKNQLENYRDINSCPFLLEGSCSIHPMRPLACRHFNVFGSPCKDGEDPYYTRRRDVLTPDEKVKHKALSMLLPVHGVTDRNERREAVRSGMIHNLAKNLHEVEWNKLASRM